VPWATYQGRSETPGHADGFGVVDADDARDLAAAAARHPRTRWCVTGLNPDGTAAAHACLPGRYHPYPAPALLPKIRPDDDVGSHLGNAPVTAQSTHRSSTVRNSATGQLPKSRRPRSSMPRSCTSNRPRQ
jgi:hypothetical protein